MAAKPVEITLRWREALEFAATAPGRPAVVVDANDTVAVSPVELLLVAAASCTASDVVLILQKQRVALRLLEVHVRARAVILAVDGVLEHRRVLGVRAHKRRAVRLRKTVAVTRRREERTERTVRPAGPELIMFLAREPVRLSARPDARGVEVQEAQVFKWVCSIFLRRAAGCLGQGGQQRGAEND